MGVIQKQYLTGRGKFGAVPVQVTGGDLGQYLTGMGVIMGQYLTGRG